jgi:hypothetical protein
MGDVRWYDGKEVVHEVEGKNGKMRKPTVKDARKHGYKPSVTSIIDVIDKPGLHIWKENELIRACFEMHGDGLLYTPEGYKVSALEKSREKTDQAVNFGKALHGEIEQYLKLRHNYNILDISKDLAAFLDPVQSWIESNDLEGFAELAMNNDRFAGTIDFTGSVNKNPTVLDFKTQKTNDKQRFNYYNTWKLQLAGYGLLMGYEPDNVDFMNVCISSTEPNLIEAKTYTAKDMKKAYRMFDRLVMHFYDEKEL